MNHSDDAAPGDKKLRLEDIAKKADVSISTVSRTSNGGARVNAETRLMMISLTQHARHTAPGRRRARSMPANAASDMLAIGAMRRLKRHGLRIPEDVAVVGYDDVQISTYTRPTLSTVRQDPVQAGRLLVAKALLAHEGQKPTSQRLPRARVLRRVGNPLEGRLARSSTQARPSPAHTPAQNACARPHSPYGEARTCDSSGIVTRQDVESGKGLGLERR